MNLDGLRALHANGKPTVGTWLQIPSPDVAEIMAAAGYDWVAIDMEHGSFGPDRLPDIVRGIECGGALPFARLPIAGKMWIKAALEAGCKGLIFPMIETSEQLIEAIDLATYPGQDTWRQDGGAPAYRGVGFCRANLFGKNFDSYRTKVAPDIYLVAQIEHIRAVENLDAILSHKRLDAIMVGPYDLSGSMGITGQFDNPQFKAVMRKISECCKKRGVHMGAHVVNPDPEALKKAMEDGYQFIAYGIDALFLWQGAERPLRELQN